MSARAVVERMMTACERASGNPWWCRVHESRIRHLCNDCDDLREWLDVAEQAQEQALVDLQAKVEELYVRCTEDPWRNEELTDWVRRDAVLALLEEAQP